MKTLFSILILISLVGCKSTSNLNVVSDFDAERYMGVWYEAARNPHRFEKNLSSVSATYSIKEDGNIKVLNKGFNDKKLEWESIEGIAKLKNNSGDGWLKVSFFKPFYASYKIIYLDEDYSQAIVTGPTYGFLWILVRDPDLSESEYQKLVGRVKAFGFETDKLIKVDQSGNS